METVPRDLYERRADQLAVGDQLFGGDTGGLHRVSSLTPYTDADHRPRVLAVLVPVDGGDPSTERWFADSPIYLASPEEIGELQATERRRDLAAALVDLTERIERNRLPLSSCDILGQTHLVMWADTRADLGRWAAALNTSVTVSGRLARVSADVPDGVLSVQVQATLPADETSTGVAASVTGADAGEGTAPAGSGDRAPDPATQTAAEGVSTQPPADAPGEVDNLPTVGAGAASVVPDGGAGTTEVTPDADAVAVFNRVTGIARQSTVKDDGRCPQCGHEAEHLIGAGCVARTNAAFGLGNCGCKHVAGGDQ